MSAYSSGRGLADWLIDGFKSHRTKLFKLRWQATRLREGPVIWSMLLVLGANLLLFWSMSNAAMAGHLELDRLVTFASAAIATSMIAFGGLSWALDGAAAPSSAVLLLRQTMESVDSQVISRDSADNLPQSEIVFKDVSFSYPATDKLILDHFDLRIPAGSSFAIVGQNGAGKTTLAKLLCRLYDSN